MALFYIFACLLVVAGLAAIIPGVLHAGNAQSESGREELDQLDTNIKIAREKRANLLRALDDGAIDQASFDTELANLENALALDLSAESKQRESSRSGVFIAVLIALFLPIASGAMYLHLGTPKGVDKDAMHTQALAEQQQQQQNQQAPSLTELLPNLERKLEANPEDRDGWKLLGRSYLSIGEFKNANRALMRAYSLDKNDPDLLAQLAETNAMLRDGDLSGKAGKFLDQALALNPQHEQSLWLKAISEQRIGKHKEAIARFESLRAGVADNPDALASIDELINQSKTALGIPISGTSEPDNNAASESSSQNADADADGDNAQPASEDSTPAQSDVSNSAVAALSVIVSLAEHVIADVAPGDSVFIFARATNGPPMPLAVSRHTVSELPVTVVLDDSMAMMPAMTLSQFPNVTVGARVSKSGNAIAQPGDWFTELNNVEVKDSDTLELTIDTKK